MSYVFPTEGKDQNDNPTTITRPDAKTEEVSGPDAKTEKKKSIPTGYSKSIHMATIGGDFSKKKKASQRDLKICAVTWNMHGKDPPANSLMRGFLPAGHDVYAIGTQECERSIEASLFIRSKAAWTGRLTKLLGPEYYEVGQENLQAIHLIIFARKTLQREITLICNSQVATGWADFIGNKGGTAIGFDIGSTSVAFVCSHLAAFNEGIENRNLDFKKIHERLDMRSSSGLPTLAERFDNVFWLGDLNYRINGNRTLVDALLKLDMHEVLVANDQLNIERDAGRTFQDYIEAPLTFPPTYKFDTGVDRYDTSKKMRIPSWTDRILFKPNENVVITKYASVQYIRTSDHRPVFALFKLRHDGANADRRANIAGENASGACTIM